MQQLEKKEKRPSFASDPKSPPLQTIPPVKGEESDDPEVIFAKAVAEIDTQPLPRKSKPFTFCEVIEVCLLVGVLLFSFMGIVWQCITYPHTLVVLYTKAKPASITAALDIPTRTLAPVSFTRSATTQTTGTGHQDARAASGTVTFYNGNASQQTIARGTVLTGSDGVQVSTDQALTLPAANPPYFGQAATTATTLQTGSRENIHSLDINGTVSGSVFVKNLAAFTGGRDARTFRAVAPKDITAMTTTVNATVTQAFTTAFPLQPGEAAIPTNCTTKTTPNHQTGEEAQSVTLTIAKTCSARAYNHNALTREATTAFTRSKPGASYHLVGSVQTTFQSVSPITVTISGKWVFTFSQNYQEFLAEKIAGDSPEKARAYLLRTGIIQYASIPSALPPDAMYINFLVLVG